MLLHIWTVLYFVITVVYANTETFQVILPSINNSQLHQNVSIDKIIDMKNYQRNQFYTIDIHNDENIYIKIINLPTISKYSFKLCWTALDSIDLKPSTFKILPNSIISFQMLQKSYNKDIITSNKYQINISLTKLHLGFIPDELIPILFTIISIISISILSIYLYMISSISLTT